MILRLILRSTDLEVAGDTLQRYGAACSRGIHIKGGRGFFVLVKGERKSQSQENGGHAHLEDLIGES